MGEVMDDQSTLTPALRVWAKLGHFQEQLLKTYKKPLKLGSLRLCVTLDVWLGIDTLNIYLHLFMCIFHLSFRL